MFQRRWLAVNLLSVWLSLLVSDSEEFCVDQGLPTPPGAERTLSLSVLDRPLVHHTGGIIRFQCKRGYHFVGTGSESFFLTCSSNGNWVKSFQGHCESDCSSHQFQCKSSGKCIDHSRRCNCVHDCDDQSDEAGCEATVIDTTGKSSGVLRSPGFPAGYPGKLSCTYKIITHDRNHRIKLQFVDFDLKPSTGVYCSDYLALSNEYYAGDAIYTCEYPGHCVFCGSSKPSTSFSDDNYITLKFVSTDASTTYKGFSAKWYNERITMTSGGGSSNDRNDDSYNSDSSTDDNPNVMHGTSVFLLVFLPVITIFGITFTYLRWKARLAHFRARSQQLARISLVTCEVGPAVEDPAPILNGDPALGPRLPGYSETSTPQEPPPPYEVPEETDANSAAASGEVQPPPSYDSTIVAVDTPNESAATSSEDMVQTEACVQPEGADAADAVVVVPK